MKMKTFFNFALLFSTLSVFAIDTDTDKFFKTNPDPSIKLPADQLYPRGQLFPFSFYSVGGGTEQKRGDLLPQAQKDADMKQIIEAGVTMIGPQYELNDQVVADAKKYKVKAIYTVAPEIDGQKIDLKYLNNLAKENKALDTDKLRKSVMEIVKREAGNPEIAWWSITPDELRYWRKDDMLYLKTCTEAIKEADPMKRPIYLYEPGHRDADALAKTAVFLNICSKGMYTNYFGKKNARVYCRWSIEQEVEAIKLSGVKASIPIVLPEMFQEPAENELPMIETWVRHDMYSALIAGAKGVLVFSASRRPNFPAREQYLKAYLKICRELRGPLKLGHIFLFGERRDDIALSICEGPETVELKIGKDNVKSLPSVDMADIAYDNCRYVFIANSSESPINAVVENLVYGKEVTVQDIFNPKDIFTAPEGNFSITLKPLEVMVLKISLTK